MPDMTAAVRTGAPATGAAFAELRAGARRVRVRQIEVFVTAATATGVGLAVPAAIGVTPTTTFPGYSTALPEDTADAAGVAVLASAWGTAPTTPTSTQGWRRRGFLPAAIGAGLIWTPPQGADSIITIPANGSVALFNLSASTGGACDVAFMWEE